MIWDTIHGVTKMEIAATIIMLTLEMAPDRALSSNALEVPIPFACVPSRMPWAISFLMRKCLISHGAITEPIMAFKITKTAVTDGTPPIFQIRPLQSGL